MKISMMTLGCPGWDLATVCQRAQAYGFDGVDFRGLLDEIDVTTLPAFTTEAATTRRMLTDADLEVSAISSSIKVCDADGLSDNVEEARRTIEAAHNVGACNVRVFGMGDAEAHSLEELAAAGQHCLDEILDLDGAETLHWLFETHDNWIRAVDCMLLLDRIDNPAFGALWDMGHTARVGGESPAASYAAIGPHVGYTHVKDAVYDPDHANAMRDGWRYVLPGEGDLPWPRRSACCNSTATTAGSPTRAKSAGIPPSRSRRSRFRPSSPG